MLRGRELDGITLIGVKSTCYLMAEDNSTILMDFVRCTAPCHRSSTVLIGYSLFLHVNEHNIYKAYTSTLVHYLNTIFFTS